MSEKHVRLLAMMYERRDLARLLLGDRYGATMEACAAMIRAVMAEHNCNEVDAALKLSKAASDNQNSITMIVAAAVEMLEPTKQTAQGGPQSHE